MFSHGPHVPPHGPYGPPLGPMVVGYDPQTLKLCPVPIGSPYALHANEACAATPDGENHMHGVTCQLKPFAWVRFGSDGRIDGPILDTDERMSDTRRSEWTPLHLPMIR